MGFPRQEYWSGLSFPSPGDLPNSGIEPVSLVSSALQANSLALSHWRSNEKKTWLSTYLYSEERYQKLGKSFSKQKNLRGEKRDKTRVFISGSSPRMTNTYSAGTYYQELPGLISVPFSAEPRGLLHGSITVNNQSQREKWNSFASLEADHCLPPRSLSALLSSISTAFFLSQDWNLEQWIKSRKRKWGSSVGGQICKQEGREGLP